MKVSIITPCLNRVGYIEEAIRSVMGQNYPEIEHVVVDGGSTDGTLDILRNYPGVNVLCGPDRGMYDAINKGLSVASGDIVGFLNSDDIYITDVFSDVVEKFQDDTVFAVVGGAIVFSETPSGGKVVVQEFSPTDASLLELTTLGSPFFNAWFFRRALFDKIGNLDNHYRIVADREFMLRFALSGLGYTRIPRVVYQYRHHAESMTFDINDHKLEQIVREHIYMTNIYLRKTNISQQTRLLIQQERTQDTLEMAVRALRKGKPGKTLYFLLAGMRYDLTWIAKFSKRASGRLWRLLSKGQKI